MAGDTGRKLRGGLGSRVTLAAALLAAAWSAPNSTESAVANGDTRTVTFMNQHTNEQGSFTYMVNGVYDSAVLDKLNWFMRDWRLDEPTKMDPHLFDIVWEVYRESGSQQPIDVLSGYRSPQTNAMLRRRSSQVAEHSQHMAGRAIDAHFIDVGPARIRDIAMRMQDGGVGFYPTGVTWVHIDSGSVRYWPRMSRDALTRLFPDGKTVFIPADGKPMPGYELAKAEIEARGGEIQTAGGGGIGGIFAWLFGRGGGADDAEEAGGQEAIVATSGGRGGRGGGSAAPSEPDAAVEIADAGPAAVAKAKRHLPTGPTYASAAPTQSAPQPAAPAPTPVEPPAAPPAPTAVAAAPEPAPKPQVVAALEQPNVESDAAPADAASPVKLHGPIAALYLAPLPPRRPSDLGFQLTALESIPLPPSRPTDLDVAAAPVLPPARPDSLADGSPEMTGSVPPAPPARPIDMIVATAEPQSQGAKTVPGPEGSGPPELPKIITQGTSAARPQALPPQALALAELPPSPAPDSATLLAKAADLAAPLPPMPIPIAIMADEKPVAKSEKVGLVERVSRLFGSFSFDPFRASAAPPAELRKTKQ